MALADFAVGAPFANEGAGVVYIYHGAANRETFSIKPVQVMTIPCFLRFWNFSIVTFSALDCWDEERIMIMRKIQLYLSDDLRFVPLTFWSSCLRFLSFWCSRRWFQWISRSCCGSRPFRYCQYFFAIIIQDTLQSIKTTIDVLLIVRIFFYLVSTNKWIFLIRLRFSVLVLSFVWRLNIWLTVNTSR